MLYIVVSLKPPKTCEDWLSAQSYRSYLCYAIIWAQWIYLTTSLIEVLFKRTMSRFNILVFHLGIIAVSKIFDVWISLDDNNVHMCFLNIKLGYCLLISILRLYKELSYSKLQNLLVSRGCSLLHGTWSYLCLFFFF